MSDEQPWYHNGLPFACTGCGKCCTGCPGYVWVTDKEINAISTYLSIPPEDFRRQYLRLKDGRWALVEMKSRNYDCIFLHDNKCRIYPVRPKQCITFPWWKENLTSKESWIEASRHCEGMNPTSPIVPFSTIQSTLKS